MAGKLWDKGYEPDKMIEEYTVGDDRELDMRLARYDVEGSLAHIAMLETIGLLTAEELEKLTAGLKEIAAEIEAGRFEIEPGTEDVHSQVELMLTRRLGDAGKKIHSGRSRNDQVLVDLKLFLRDELRQVADAVKRVFDRLQEQSEKYKEVLMPGYTHLQIAMPSSFGLWFGAYAETLVDDMRLVAAAWHIANQNPLGSAAGYGSSFPLDRTMTTRLMGFEELHYNVVAAQMSRGKSERAAAAAIAAVARVELLTRPAGAQLGTALTIEGGEVLSQEPAGCPLGTTLVVRDLFYNTPARMKFMKKDSAEGAAVSGVVQHLALSHPAVSFRLLRDGQEVLHTPGDGQLLSAIYAALGRDFARGLVPVSGSGGDITVSGFVTAPLMGRGSRSMQVFFVNGRFIKSQLLTAALEAKFGVPAANASILRTEFLTADKQKFE